MRDGSAERAVFGPFRVDVDPLVVAGGVREGVDLFLGDLVPVAVADVLADEALESLDAGDGETFDHG